ncbi:molybdenum cofactor guanylyltransferase [Cohnella sp. AR92]|uniref:molybdenum cofactor guanylyltransferase n=1 Tax=Cohnella sp. AR92 TaxID=648716 RepID=UPI0013154676|nr:molybdenum cofactor guanylyltransferase [Cohnella sp. AR92]
MEGAILAGGLGRRMEGRNKSLLPFHGSTLIAAISNRMASCCERVSIVVAAEEQARGFASLKLPIGLDAVPGSGPLSGLHSALASASEPFVWVSACDMPYVSPHAAMWMASRLEESGAGAVAPFIDGRLHPLQAIYRTECSFYTQDCLSRGIRRMMDLLEAIRPLVVEEAEFKEAGIDPRFVANINTAEDYLRIVSRAGEDDGCGG